MTQLLISVSSTEEAQIALDNGADLIDLKDPGKGALGALPLMLIQAISRFVSAQTKQSRRLTSATVGDLPMQPALIVEQVAAIANTKIDIIKIGFFEADDYQPCLDALKPFTQSGVKLIAVLFSEYTYPAHLVAAISEAGLYGIMIDTANKNGMTFLDYFSIDEIKNIASDIQKHGLVFGLAGSLKLQNCAVMSQIGPNYVGFRGGVCADNQRQLALDAGKISAIRQAL